MSKSTKAAKAAPAKSTKAAPAAASTETTFAPKEGDTVTFKGYAQLEDGQEPIFTAGEQVRIVTVVDAETFQCVSLTDPKKTDSAFDTEIAPASDTAAAETTAPANGGKVKLKKGAAPAPADAPPAEGKKPKSTKEKAKAKAKAEKKEDELQPLAPEAYDAETRKVIKTDASALKAAKSLAEKIKETFWTLGGVLSFIRRHKSYATIEVDGVTPYSGKQGFAQYVEAELDTHYRKAMYYIEIYETFAPLGISEEQVLALGWSKAKELCGVVNAKNVEKWLKKANELGREDLQAEIKSVRVKAGDTGTTDPGETAKATTFKFRLFEDQGQVVQEALKAASAVIGDDDLNKAFAHIATEWLTLQGGSAKVGIEQAFAALENSYGLAEVSGYARMQYKK
jgi:hypothetical protein